MNREEFIEKSKKIHGNDKFNYDGVIYKNNKTKVLLRCNCCGLEFAVRPDNHLNKHSGCPHCFKKKKYSTTEQFIERAIKVHGNKYDYSKVAYCDAETKVCIICPIHGEFWQTPTSHLNGQGCSKCAKNYHYTEEEILEILNNKYPFYSFEIKNNNVIVIDENKCEHFVKLNTLLHKEWKPKIITSTSYLIHCLKEKFGDFYDYSLVKFENRNTKIRLKVKSNGKIIENFYYYFLNLKIASSKYREEVTTLKFIERATEKYGILYDYSKVNYKDAKTKVCIICPIHGEFWQTPNNFLNGNGCPKCNKERVSQKTCLTTENFIEKAKVVHGNLYDYSKVEYKNSQTKVCIICPIHGEFWQTPSSHLMNHGCPSCNASKLEKEVKKLNFEYEFQKHFDWLGKQSLDFYIPLKNIAIECQGKQHFGEGGFGSENYDFEKTLKLDIKKKHLCNENNVYLIYFLPSIKSKINISDKKFEGIYCKNNVFYNIDELEKFISNFNENEFNGI